jgi:hypothetical protein
MSGTRIYQELAKFVSYTTDNNTYLHGTEVGDTDKRGIVLGMSDEEMTTLADFSKKLVSGDPVHPGYWDLHNNPDTKNKLTRKNMLMIRKEFNTFFRPILNRISGSAVLSNKDMLKLNINLPPEKHKKPEKKIEAFCNAAIKLIGGCIIKIVCRPTTDTKRASKPEGADALIFAYRIDKPILVKDPNGGEPIIQEVVPIKGPDDGTTKITQTKATFTIEFGMDNLNATLQFYTRWINTKYPDLSGPWTGPYSTGIS